MLGQIFFVIRDSFTRLDTRISDNRRSFSFRITPNFFATGVLFASGDSGFAAAPSFFAHLADRPKSSRVAHPRFLLFTKAGEIDFFVLSFSFLKFTIFKFSHRDQRRRSFSRSDVADIFFGARAKTSKPFVLYRVVKKRGDGFRPALFTPRLLPVSSFPFGGYLFVLFFLR